MKACIRGHEGRADSNAGTSIISYVSGGKKNNIQTIVGTGIKRAWPDFVTTGDSLLTRINIHDACHIRPAGDALYRTGQCSR